MCANKQEKTEVIGGRRDKGKMIKVGESHREKDEKQMGGRRGGWRSEGGFFFGGGEVA